MYTILVKTSEAHLEYEEEIFSQAISWANSMTNYEENGKVISVEIFEGDKLVVSLRTIK